MVNSEYASIYFFMSVVSNYSLFPLVFKQLGTSSFQAFRLLLYILIFAIFCQEFPIKSLLLVATTIYNYTSLKYQYKFVNYLLCV